MLDKPWHSGSSARQDTLRAPRDRGASSLAREVIMAACTIIGMGPGLGLPTGRRFGRAGLAIGTIARKEETLATPDEVIN